jgi:hypothetical protein
LIRFHVRKLTKRCRPAPTMRPMLSRRRSPKRNSRGGEGGGRSGVRTGNALQSREGRSASIGPFSKLPLCPPRGGGFRDSPEWTRGGLVSTMIHLWAGIRK